MSSTKSSSNYTGKTSRVEENSEPGPPSYAAAVKQFIEESYDEEYIRDCKKLELTDTFVMCGSLLQEIDGIIYVIDDSRSTEINIEYNDDLPQDEQPDIPMLGGISRCDKIQEATEEQVDLVSALTKALNYSRKDFMKRIHINRPGVEIIRTKQDVKMYQPSRVTDLISTMSGVYADYGNRKGNFLVLLKTDGLSTNADGYDNMKAFGEFADKMQTMFTNIFVATDLFNKTPRVVNTWEKTIDKVTRWDVNQGEEEERADILSVQEEGFVVTRMDLLLKRLLGPYCSLLDRVDEDKFTYELLQEYKELLKRVSRKTMSNTRRGIGSSLSTAATASSSKTVRRLLGIFK